MASEKISFKFPDGREYVGTIENNCPNGTGTMFFPNGDVYEGEWNDGKMSGKGIYRFYDTEKDKFISEYSGSFKNNVIEGTGRRVYADKTVYLGTWQNGKRTGNGACWYSDGTYSYGIWKFDRMIRGIIHFPSGDIYDGELKSGVFEGFGKYICKKDGSIFEGVYKDGKPLTGTKIFSDHRIEHLCENNVHA